MLPDPRKSVISSATSAVTPDRKRDPPNNNSRVSTGTNSALKLYIITSIDRKLPLDDIASAKGLEMPDFIKEMEAIVYSGTKLNIDYWLEDILDEDQQEEIHEYFLEAETDKIDAAMEEFDGDYDDEELRLYRLKFISEVAN